MNEFKECKYRLPCGWCDRKNEKCELLQESIPETKISHPVSNIGTSATFSHQCNHMWEYQYALMNSTKFKCSRCGAIKYR